MTLEEFAHPDHKQHCFSDHCLGIIYIAIHHTENLKKADGDMFETCFIRGVKIGKIHIPHGEPCIGPDGRVLLLEGNYKRPLMGKVNSCQFAISNFTVRTVKNHKNFKPCLSFMLYGGDFNLPAVEPGDSEDEDENE